MDISALPEAVPLRYREAPACMAAMTSLRAAGFTLIEVLITVAVVAIIAAVVRGSHDALKPVASKIDAAITKPVDVQDLLRLIAQTRGRSHD